MKLLFAFLGIFIIYLSCMPCCESEEYIVKAEERISAADDHQQNSHDKESCSPFCTCSCCAAAIFSHPLSKIQVTKVDPVSEKFPLFNVSVIAGAHYAIWQPPQLLA